MDTLAGSFVSIVSLGRRLGRTPPFFLKVAFVGRGAAAPIWRANFGQFRVRVSLSGWVSCPSYPFAICMVFSGCAGERRAAEGDGQVGRGCARLHRRAGRREDGEPLGRRGGRDAVARQEVVTEDQGVGARRRGQGAHRLHA